MNQNDLWPCRIDVSQPPQQLLRLGPLIPGIFSKSDDVSGLAGGTTLLLDTGADGAGIDESYAAQIGLPLHRMQDAHGLHGSMAAKKYLAVLVLPVAGKNGQRVMFRIPIECIATPGLSDFYASIGMSGVVGVIGRSFLQFCKLSIDGATGESSILIFPEIMQPRL